MTSKDLYGIEKNDEVSGSHFKNWVEEADSWFTWLPVRDSTELCSYVCISAAMPTVRVFVLGFFWLLFRSCFFVLIQLWTRSCACLIQNIATCLWLSICKVMQPTGPHSWAFLGSCPTNAQVPSLQPRECSIPNPSCFALGSIQLSLENLNEDLEFLFLLLF